ncbi:MAG: DUF1294 domain-containing protein [Ruminococcaceae bacterium]|nr:DUF1294 domain-containing protein [Oscillospiraceae bacterium]
MISFYLIYLIALSVITLILYGADKRRARANAWRIPERVLLGASLLGGAVGGLLGMRLFRHKTKHWYFTAINVIGLILHAVLLFLLITNV